MCCADEIQECCNIRASAEVKGDLIYEPWIGCDYAKQDVKLLILGESIYCSTGDSRRYCRSDYLQCVIWEYAIKGFCDGKSVMHRNLGKMIWNECKDKGFRKQVWRRCAYVNIVQKILAGVKSRPHSSDFSVGWDSVIKLLKILMPDICLVVGVASWAKFKRIKEEGVCIRWQAIEKIKVNGCYPRSARCEVNGKLIDFVFVKHPSARFSWRVWRNYLLNHYPTIIGGLDARGCCRES